MLFNLVDCILPALQSTEVTKDQLIFDEVVSTTDISLLSHVFLTETLFAELPHELYQYLMWQQNTSSVKKIILTTAGLHT